MGNFNAKIGSDNQGYENVIGVHGLGVMNDNGERFVNACAINNIVIGGSVFTHKIIHKATWVSPDQVTENQTHRHKQNVQKIATREALILCLITTL